jgi:DNA-binding NarL/FixJ family response regulator
VTIRVLIADDDPIVRSALRAILSAADGIDVVGEAEDGERAAVDAAALRPDVVLMDVRMPGGDGVTATARITARLPETRVIILTTFDTDEALHGSLRGGASGFLLKRTSFEQIVQAVRTVHEGEALLSPAVTRRVLDAFTSQPAPAAAERLELLTDREREVLMRVGRGESNAEIAAAMFLGEQTVKTHLKRVYAKLGLRDRAQAVVLAYETGLVVPGRASGEGPDAGGPPRLLG